MIPRVRGVLLQISPAIRDLKRIGGGMPHIRPDLSSDCIWAIVSRGSLRDIPPLGALIIMVFLLLRSETSFVSWSLVTTTRGSTRHPARRQTASCPHLQKPPAQWGQFLLLFYICCLDLCPSWGCRLGSMLQWGIGALGATILISRILGCCLLAFLEYFEGYPDINERLLGRILTPLWGLPYR